ncbi:glycosyltransferase [Pullulanibacillus sp. KACC 23026]|uniref:MGDG synthase family glycosyltransferase n=1 Tax=Pullulanibacillus sp. KACC 23026 TaxID=3028315 RepID=UPI0023B007DE|nr:glycosyltransferase [Pullulanibacillus sp. KACC 23026]WEG12549.1 glycosyltransferase [Pullulanibacillus sp. KACC 23026]
MTKSILILTGRYGDGHQKAADAIAEVVKDHYPDVKPIVFDVTDLLPTMFDKLGKHIFIKGIKRFPNLYDYLYEKTREETKASVLFKNINRIGLTDLEQYIESVQPMGVVSTFPVASGMLSLLKREGRLQAPIFTVITDHTVHSSWVYPNIDHYFVASEDVKKRLMDFNIRETAITVTGIPIHPKFSSPYSKPWIKRKLGLSDAPCLLLVGGGFGIFRNLASILEELNEIPIKMTLVIICGRNDKLYRRLKQQTFYTHHRLQILGFVENMNEWMAAADLLITKPGGMTVSEALALEVPMIIVQALGGQENDNLRFLLDSGTSLYAKDPQTLIKQLNYLFLANGIEDLREALKKFVWQKQSALNVAKVMMDVIKTKQKQALRLVSLG